MKTQEKMKEALLAALEPVRLEIVNDSHHHIGHGGDDGSGETHFSVYIVSERFMSMKPVERHRFVFDILKKSLKIMPHSIVIRAFSPREIQGEL